MLDKRNRRKGQPMLTLNDIHTLASRPKRADASVLTVYLDLDQSKQANLNRGFETQLKDMLAGIESTKNGGNDIAATPAFARKLRPGGLESRAPERFISRG